MEKAKVAVCRIHETGLQCLCRLPWDLNIILLCAQSLARHFIAEARQMNITREHKKKKTTLS